MKYLSVDCGESKLGVWSFFFLCCRCFKSRKPFLKAYLVSRLAQPVSYSGRQEGF